MAKTLLGALVVLTLVLTPIGAEANRRTIRPTYAADTTYAPDITGKWTTAFETQVGTMNLTFDFTVKEGKLTGTIVGKNDQLGEMRSVISNGKVDGDTVTMTETLSIQGMDIQITYTGKIVSADEIKFTRNVAEFATEEFVAKRVKA